MAALSALAELRAEAHMSVSAIATYMQCPRKYELSYLCKVPPTHRPGPLSFGSAVHEALAVYYDALRMAKPEPSKQALAEAFVKAWRAQLTSPIPTLLDAEQTEQQVEESGVALVEAFHDLAPRPHRVIEVEMPFSIELAHPDTGEVLQERLIGVFDAVVQDQDGRFRVLEHKTASRRWTEDRLSFDSQLTGYSIAAAATGLGDAGITVQLLLKLKKPALELYHPTRTDDDRKDFLRLVFGVHRAIQAGAFFARRDWSCKTCPWAGPCLAG